MRSTLKGFLVLDVAPAVNVSQVLNPVVGEILVDVVNVLNGPRSSAPGVDNPAVVRVNDLAVPANRDS